MVRPLIDKWNAAHPNEKVTFKEQSDQADQQHDDLVQHFQAKSADYDVVDVDVVWTAEFAAKGWLQPLKDKMAVDTSQAAAGRPSTTATYNEHAVRGTADHRRRDAVLPQGPGADPAEDLGRDDGRLLASPRANGIGCYAGQFAKYEGLTVNASEAINSAGGTSSTQTASPTLNTAEAKTGLQQPGRRRSRTATSRRRPSRTRRSRAGRPSRPASSCSCATGRTSTASPRPTARSKVKDTFGDRAASGWTARPPSAATTPRSACTRSTRPPRSTSSSSWTSEETQKFFATQGSLAPVLGLAVRRPGPGRASCRTCRC